MKGAHNKCGSATNTHGRMHIPLQDNDDEPEKNNDSNFMQEKYTDDCTRSAVSEDVLGVVTERLPDILQEEGLITSASADRYAQNSSPGFINTFSILEETVIELEIDALTTTKSEDKTNQIEAYGIAEEQLGGNKEMCQETGQA